MATLLMLFVRGPKQVECEELLILYPRQHDLVIAPRKHHMRTPFYVSFLRPHEPVMTGCTRSCSSP